MKKEMEMVLKDEFLSSILDEFYDINFSSTGIVLQAHFKSDLVKEIREKCPDFTWRVTERGYLEMVMDKTEEQEGKKITIEFVFT